MKRFRAMASNRALKRLSERHTGLLIRMSYHRAAVGPKSVFAPLEENSGGAE